MPGGLHSKLALTLVGLLVFPPVVVWVYELATGGPMLPVLVTAGAAFVAMLVGMRSIGRCTEPVQRLTTTLQAIARGEEHEPLHLSRGDEFDLLAEAANQVELRLADTRRQAAEERGRLSSILAHLTSGVILLDADGTVVVANPAARRLLSVAGEPTGRNHRFVHRNYDLGVMLERVRRTTTEAEREVTLYNPELLHLHVIALPIAAGEESGAGVLVVLRDITEARRLEQLKANLIADASHELKTPVTAIRGFAETLLDGALERPEAAERFVHIIKDEADRMQRLIEDLLQLSLIESRGVRLEESEVDMRSMVEDLVRRFTGRAHGREIDLMIGSDTASKTVVTGDRHYLEQAVSNLLDNALKFTPGGGLVRVSLENRPGERLRVAVSDTGVGIPDEDVPHVFHRFFRVERARGRKGGGTGLGLAIVKHIVSAHHGTVGVESRIGEGSKFWMELPLAES